MDLHGPSAGAGAPAVRVEETCSLVSKTWHQNGNWATAETSGEGWRKKQD